MCISICDRSRARSASKQLEVRWYDCEIIEKIAIESAPRRTNSEFEIQSERGDSIARSRTIHVHRCVIPGIHRSLPSNGRSIDRRRSMLFLPFASPAASSFVLRLDGLQRNNGCCSLALIRTNDGSIDRSIAPPTRFFFSFFFPPRPTSRSHDITPSLSLYLCKVNEANRGTSTFPSSYRDYRGNMAKKSNGWLLVLAGTF